MRLWGTQHPPFPPIATLLPFSSMHNHIVSNFGQAWPPKAKPIVPYLTPCTTMPPPLQPNSNAPHPMICCTTHGQLLEWL
nr:hypothetical protein Iba_chr10bCG5070 [Ipomoea batatas]